MADRTSPGRDIQTSKRACTGSIRGLLRHPTHSPTVPCGNEGEESNLLPSLRGQSRRWREANPEKARARKAAYRAANRESRRAYIAGHCASQKDATRLHARDRPLRPRRPLGSPLAPTMNGRRIARGDPPPPSLPPLTETTPIPGVKLPDGETTKATVRRPSLLRLMSRRLGLKGETP